MGQAAVVDFYQGFCFGLSATAGNTAKKQRLPIGRTIQKDAGLAQCRGIKALEKNIVLKDQDIPCPFLKALFQTMHVGLKNTLFPVFRMPGHNDKLDPIQQTDIGKLFFCLLPPVAAAINGDAVDLVEKGPTARSGFIRLVHAAGFVIC